MPPAAQWDTGGDGPPITLIGGADAVRAFASLSEAIRDPWRVVRWTTDDTGEAGALALLGLLDDLGIERAVLAGAGPGIAVALRAGLASPDRLRSLVLIGALHTVELPAGLDDRLVELESPALVIHGSDASRASHDLAASLCQGLPDCRGVVDIAGAGDHPHASHAAHVATTLLDFLRTLPA